MFCFWCWPWQLSQYPPQFKKDILHLCSPTLLSYCPSSQEMPVFTVQTLLQGKVREILLKKDSCTYSYLILAIFISIVNIGKSAKLKLENSSVNIKQNWNEIILQVQIVMCTSFYGRNLYTRSLERKSDFLSYMNIPEAGKSNMINITVIFQKLLKVYIYHIYVVVCNS